MKNNTQNNSDFLFIPPNDMERDVLLKKQGDNSELNNELSNTEEAEEISLINIEKYLRQWLQLSEMLYEKFNKKIVTIVTISICGLKPEEKIKDRVMLQSHNDIVFPSIESHGGGIIRSSGSMVVSFFPEAVEAVWCALDIQVRINEFNYKIMEKTPNRAINVKIGVSSGHTMIDGENLYGDAVKQAAVIESLVGEDEILISNLVYEQIKDIEEIETLFHKKIRIKGKRKIIELYKVIWPKIIFDDIININPSKDDDPIQYESEAFEELPNAWIILAMIQMTILLLYLILKQ